MLRKLILCSLAFLAVAIATTAGLAQLPDLSVVEKNFRSIGITVTRSQANSTTELVVRGNQAKLLESIPLLQTMGLLNPDITQTDLNQAPVTFSGLVLMEVVVGYLQALYRGVPSVDKFHCRALLDLPDDYGHLETHEAFSFRFDRRLYRKIDWNNFIVARFPKVAPGFALSRWFSAQ
jgi:hypothetical protein